MSNTIGGISSTISNTTSGVRPPPPRGARPDLSKVADEFFGKLDTGNKGYVDKADLQNAVEQVARTQKLNASTSAPSAEDLLKAFDGNGDGKITKQEFSDGTKKLAEQFDNQFNRTRTSFDLASGSASNANGIPSAEDLLKALDTDSDGKITQQEFSKAFEEVAKQSGPPPPPPGAAPGAGGPPSATSANSSTTYQAADTNQDGTVSEPERIAYEISSAYLSTSINSYQTSETQQGDNAKIADAVKITRQILQFLQNYAQNTDTSVASQSASVDVSV